MKDESLSPLGFGMLRIDAENPEHQKAVAEAIAQGITLFDLGDFESDPAAFRAKAELLRGLSDQAGRSVRALVRGRLGAAERFRAELGFPTIYLVSDPEFALAELEWDHARLYARVAADLDHLETFVHRRKILSYGVGSAGFTYAKEDPEALALEPLFVDEAGKRAENREGFRWIEFPFNLYESEAATETNQSIGPTTGTLLEAARFWGLTTVARRPFDAMTESGLRRLVNYPDHHRLDLDEAVRRTLEVALTAEVETFAKANHARSEAGVPREELAPLWAHRLRDQLRHVTDPEQWKEILRRRILPDLAALREFEETSPTFGTYFQAMDAFLLAVRLWCEKSAAERNERLRARIVEAMPGVARERRPADRDLAVLALRIYRSVPGLGAILVGMRSPKYVRDLSEAAGKIPTAEVHAALVAAHTALTPPPEEHAPR